MFLAQLKIFLLESGLGHPEFLSEGNGRIRRSSQLLQKLMELFYDFIIPGNPSYHFTLPSLIISFTVVRYPLVLLKLACENMPYISISEIMENEEEECDTDLERQNVEELYDYVTHLHQKEEQGQNFDVQHPALIPVLRPYQSQAVNWMLRREKYKTETSEGKMITPVSLYVF